MTSQSDDGDPTTVNSTTGEPPTLPIQCVYSEALQIFRVTRNRGKTLSAGGFGVVISLGPATTTQSATAVDTSGDAQDDDTTADKRTETKTSCDYLFIEEVLYLHERGLVEVLMDNAPLDSFELYNLLEPCGLELGTYLVYAHLRAQAFRVRRHAPQRRQILKEMAILNQELGKNEIQQQASSTDSVSTNERSTRVNDTDNPTRTLAQLKLNLRHVEARASPPTMFQVVRDLIPTIAYDVYEPTAAFSRSSPGLPDLYVAATFYNASGCLGSNTSLSFWDLKKLLTFADGTPLRIATVSDSGTLTMFGVTDFGTPEIS